MTLYSDPIEVDREAVIRTIHALQVDLKLLADWLARQSDPVMQAGVLILLGSARMRLAAYSPSLRRH